MPTAQKSVQRERLTREAVADRALQIADRDGLDALTIRRLATDLGVTPMALYWHFADKDALIAGVAEQLLSTVELPQQDSTSGDWSDELHTVLTALLTALRAHPRVSRLAKTQMLASPAGLAIAERALVLLRAGGFDVNRAAQLASRALQTIVELVVSEPGAEVDFALEDRTARIEEKKARLRALPPDSYPEVARSIDALTSCKDQADYYDFGLEVFIAGVRAAQQRYGGQR